MNNSSSHQSLQTEALKLFDEKRNMFLQTAARIVRCRWLAEDVIQEAILKVCENGVDSSVRRLTPYIFRMVQNLAIECARRQGREQRIICTGADTSNVAAPCACPEAGLQHCEALKSVLEALSELPERTRRVFEAHRIECIPQREIAAQIGVSPTLVNFMVRDAHKHCQLRLQSYEASSSPLPPVRAKDGVKAKQGTPVKKRTPAKKRVRQRQHRADAPAVEVGRSGA